MSSHPRASFGSVAQPDARVFCDPDLDAVQRETVVDDAAARLGHPVRGHHVRRHLRGRRLPSEEHGAELGDVEALQLRGHERDEGGTGSMFEVSADDAGRPRQERTDDDAEAAHVGERNAGEPAVRLGIHAEAQTGRPRSSRQRVVREHGPLGLTRGAARRNDECVTRFHVLAGTQTVEEPLPRIPRQTRVDGQDGVARLPRRSQRSDEVVAGGRERDEARHSRSMDCCIGSAT